MSELCVKIGCPRYIRLSEQDPCSGESVPGVGNGMFMQCTRNVNLEKVIRDPEISEFVSDCGIPDRYVQDAQLQGFNLTLELAKMSPELEALLNGDTLLVDTGVNVGVIYEAVTGCTSAPADPRFVAELFYDVRECSSGGSASFVRWVVPGLRFQPAQMGKEGQIGFQTYTATSDPTFAAGLIANADGPYGDFPAAIVADITALGADFLTPGFWFVDDTDPAAAVDLDSGTCYSATVPAPIP